MTKICLLLLLFQFTEYSNAQGQSLTKEEKKFILRNSKTICKDSLFDNANWKSIITDLKNKHIILLGEPNHGAKEIFETRNNLIEKLHRELNVKTILFESGIGELITADLEKEELTPAQMTNGLFGGWRTEEFRELMAFIKAEKISIAGFDVQRSGGSFASLLKQIAIKKNIDSTLYNNLEDRYGILTRELSNRKVEYDSINSKTIALIYDYQMVHASLLKFQSSDSSKEFQLTLITIKNRIRFLSYMLAFAKDKDWSKRWAARDSAMAENIQWLLENIYRDGPVVIIGHNFHIAKFNEEESVMGEILFSTYGKEMYSLGAFAGSGSYYNNSGKEEQILPPDSTQSDIKHVIELLNGTVNFIDIPEKKKTGSDWLNKEIIVNDTFNNLSNGNKMILSKHFDGLLLFHKISPPAIN